MVKLVFYNFLAVAFNLSRKKIQLKVNKLGSRRSVLVYVGKDGRTFRVCDYQGMQCLYRNRNDLLSLQQTKTPATAATEGKQHETTKKQQQQKPWCKCDRNCDDSEFFVQNLVSGQKQKFLIIENPAARGQIILL